MPPAVNSFFTAFYDSCMAPLERHLLRARRQALLAPIRGEVLEIGAGTGANLNHYPALERLVLAEPQAGFRRKLVARVGSLHRDSTRIVDAWAESLPFPDETFDAIVCTLVLCSVDNLSAALHEIWRLLRPAGTFHFIEHVSFEDGWRARAQHAMTPLWSRIAGGCRLDRHTLQEIRRFPFRIEHAHREVIAGVLPLVTAVAVRSSTTPRR